MVKNLPPIQEIQETQIQSLGLEDPLEKGMATDSSIVAWRTPWTEETGGLQSVSLQSWTRLEPRSTHAHFQSVHSVFLD